MDEAVVLRGLGAATLAAALAACSPPPKPADGVPETAVTVTDAACVPNELRVLSGRNRFVITNASMRPLEWEILDGVMVVDERENIAPGFVQTLTAALKPGEYVMTCGLLTNPRGRLVVEADPNAGKAAATPLAFVSAQAEYKVYVHGRTAAMQAQVAALAEALRAGDAARAKALYGPSREAWQELAPVAPLLSGPYDRLEGNASLYAGGEADPAFVGWHRIEAALFGGGSASPEQLAALGDALQADAAAFADGINGAKLGAERILGGASGAARRIGERKLRGLDNPLAGSDLDDARANLAGLRRVVEVFSNALGEHAPESLAAMRLHLDALDAGLAGGDAKALADDAMQLSAAFAGAVAQLGL